LLLIYAILPELHFYCTRCMISGQLSTIGIFSNSGAFCLRLLVNLSDKTFCM